MLHHQQHHKNNNFEPDYLPTNNLSSLNTRPSSAVTFIASIRSDDPSPLTRRSFFHSRPRGHPRGTRGGLLQLARLRGRPPEGRGHYPRAQGREEVAGRLRRDRVGRGRQPLVGRIRTLRRGGLRQLGHSQWRYVCSSCSWRKGLVLVIVVFIHPVCEGRGWCYSQRRSCSSCLWRKELMSRWLLYPLFASF